MCRRRSGVAVRRREPLFRGSLGVLEQLRQEGVGVRRSGPRDEGREKRPAEGGAKPKERAHGSATRVGERDASVNRIEEWVG